MDFILSVSSFTTADTVIKAEGSIPFYSMYCVMGLPLSLKGSETFLASFALLSVYKNTEIINVLC